MITVLLLLVQFMNKRDFMNIQFKGLTSKEVEKQRELGHVNTLPKIKSKSNLRIILGHTFTLFNLYNLIIACFLFYVGEYLSTLYLGINVMNIAIRSYQEIRAKRIVENLTILISKDVKVMRDGEIQLIQSEDLVLGDYVVYRSGDQIASDAMIIESLVEVNESNLTGESVPVFKTEGDELLSGSYIISGSCVAKTIRVGLDSFAQKITHEARNYVPVESELMKTFMSINQVCTYLVVPIGALLAYQSIVLRLSELRDTVLLTSTVLLGLLPKGLVLLTSLSFFVSVFRLANKRTLVQEIYSIEVMSKVDVLCIDKTGTLTEGNMIVQFVERTDSSADVFGSIQNYIAHSKDVDSTTVALRNHFGEKMVEEQLAVVPFSSIRKWGAMTFESGTYYLGAPDVLVPDLEYSERMVAYQNDGSRILMFATGQSLDGVGDHPEGIHPLALIAISDPVRLDVSTALDFFKDNEVTVKVISGDNIQTLIAISQKAGIENPTKAIDIRGLDTDEALRDAVLNHNVIGRASPYQKQRMIQLLQAEHKVVGMVGDGVNDVLALRSADASVAMGSGSAAARQAAQIVLLDNNFTTMKDVVMEGRLVANNISRSASLYYMGTLFTFLIACVAISLNTAYPFAPIQISLMSMFVEGMPSTLVTFEASYGKPKENVLVTIIRNILPIGIIMSIAFVILLNNPYTVDVRTTMIYYITVYFSFLLVLIIFQPLTLKRLGVLLFSAASFIAVSFILRPYVYLTAIHLAEYQTLLTIGIWGTLGVFGLRAIFTKKFIKRGLSI